MSRFTRSLLAGLLGVGAATGLPAGEAVPAYGLQDESSYIVTAWDMQSADGLSSWAQTADGHRDITSGVGVLSPASASRRGRRS